MFKGLLPPFEKSYWIQMIESLDDDRSRLIQDETFSGLLVGPINGRYGEQTEANFHGVNEAIKERAESMSMKISETSTDAEGSEPTAA